MIEKKLYEKFKSCWKGYIKRIELKSELGMPDCHLINSRKEDVFLELKQMERKFINAALPIKKTQFIWFAEYKGKNAYMLFRVAKVYYLFERKAVKHLRGKVNWNAFENLAIIKSESIPAISNYCFHYNPADKISPDSVKL